MDEIFLDFEWDQEKRLRTLRQRNVDFRSVADFDFSRASTIEDSRIDHGEPRFLSTSYIGERLFVLCWTPRSGRLRVIISEEGK